MGFFEKLFKGAAKLPDRTTPVIARVLGRVTPTPVLRQADLSAMRARERAWEAAGNPSAAETCHQTADRMSTIDLSPVVTTSGKIEMVQGIVLGFRLKDRV